MFSSFFYKITKLLTFFYFQLAQRRTQMNIVHKTVIRIAKEKRKFVVRTVVNLRHNGPLLIVRNDDHRIIILIGRAHTITIGTLVVVVVRVAPVATHEAAREANAHIEATVVVVVVDHHRIRLLRLLIPRRVLHRVFQVLLVVR